jgi:hypothetical protein
MDIEQLKLILETLQGVGHEAGNLAVLYLWLQFGSSALGYLSPVSVLLGAGWIIFKAIRMGYGGDVCEQFLCEMRDQLGTGIRGSLSNDERARTMAAIRALVAEKRAKEQK